MPTQPPAAPRRPLTINDLLLRHLDALQDACIDLIAAANIILHEQDCLQVILSNNAYEPTPAAQAHHADRQAAAQRNSLTAPIRQNAPSAPPAPSNTEAISQPTD